MKLIHFIGRLSQAKYVLQTWRNGVAYAGVISAANHVDLSHQIRLERSVLEKGELKEGKIVWGSNPTQEHDKLEVLEAVVVLEDPFGRLYFSLPDGSIAHLYPEGMDFKLPLPPTPTT